MGFPMHKEHVVIRDGYYTYGDYRQWPQDDRWELIHGSAYAMAAPNWNHQSVVGVVFRELSLFLKGKSCRAFISPVDVFLTKATHHAIDIDAIETIVQPDLGVVCDSSQIIPQGILGAPQIVMEVLSPSSVLHDLNRKKELYCEQGCLEYWIWDNAAAWVVIYSLQANGNWDEGRSFGSGQKADSRVLEGFWVDIQGIIAEIS